MTVEERLLYSIATLVYKSLNNLAPTYLSEKFHYVSQCHTYNTRSALCNDLMLPRSNTALFTHSFIYQGATLWNKLPLHVRLCPNLFNFKQLVYKSLNNLAPTYLSEKFHYVSQCHTYNTRSALCNDLMLPRSNTALFTHSFIYQGATLWNKLPLHVRLYPNLFNFKQLVKTHILNAK